MAPATMTRIENTRSAFDGSRATGASGETAVTVVTFDPVPPLGSTGCSSAELMAVLLRSVGTLAGTLPSCRATNQDRHNVARRSYWNVAAALAVAASTASSSEHPSPGSLL